MNFRKFFTRVLALGLVVAVSAATTGCGAFVLSEQFGYAASVQRMRTEMAAGARDAVSAGQRHDTAGFEAARNRVLNVCGDAERLANYGEAAIRSFYAQQSSAAVMAQIRREEYEHDCKVDGLDRLHEQTVELDDTAHLLHDACGCTLGSYTDTSSVHITRAECSLGDAVWDDYWGDNTRGANTVAWAVVTAIPSIGIIPIFMGAGILGGMISNVPDKVQFCDAVHVSYDKQFRHVAALKKQCATAPPPPSFDEQNAAMDADTLNQYIQASLESARSDGEGSTSDGSSVYAEAWEALQQCNGLAASLGPAVPEDDASADVDTHVDQEPGESSYEIPEYAPPPEPTPSPGGG